MISLNSQGPVGPLRSREENRKRPRPDTKSIPPFHPIFKSDNAEGNNSSNTKIPPQIMPLQKNPTARHNLLHGQLIRTQAGHGGHLLHHGRRLPRHGGHLQDGKSNAHMCSFTPFCSMISLTCNGDSLVSDGRCKHHTAPRALTQTFSRVWLKELNRLQHASFVSTFEQSFIILVCHVSCAVRVV